MTNHTLTTTRGIVLAALIAALVGVGPSTVHAAELEVAGWIPYWRDTAGIASARKHIDKLDTIHPFVFTVRSDGTLVDHADLSERQWERLFDRAEDQDVEVIPTIAWSDGAGIHRVLSDTRMRRAHIAEIVEMVEDGRYDGVDIDYEAKLADTRDSFSRFLEELKDELGRKVLTCTVEARTPPESRYREVPATLSYANDYQAMAKHCDRIEIMAYDQRRDDIRLNEEKAGAPYMPVADADWVEKVVMLALEDIPAEKIMLGIPTYGHRYRVTVAPNWYRSYERLEAMNEPAALALAREYRVTPGVNRAGERSFSYFPESSVYRLLRSLPVPAGTQPGNEAAAQALLFANATGMTLTFDLVWYADADAAAEKVFLAEALGLRGVAFFKIDGEENEGIWDLF